MLTRAEYVELMENARTHGVNYRWGAYVEGKILSPDEGGVCRFCNIVKKVSPIAKCGLCPMDDGDLDDCCKAFGVWVNQPSPQNAIPVVDRLKSLDIPAFADKLVALGLLEA